jgi:choline dehydrogenase-like flavoprotein
MHVSRMTHLLFSAQVFRFDKLFSFHNTARIMIKAKDTLGGRLTDSGGVRKKLIDADRNKILHGYENAKKILLAAGAKDIYKTWYLAAHPGGTVKIGELVDANLKTHVDNLYVCDCSVIPEAWGLPPMMSIIGLGKRLARQLSGEKEKATAPGLIGGMDLVTPGAP